MEIKDIIISSIFVYFLTIISITDIRIGLIRNKILLPMAVIALILDLSDQLITIDEAIIAAFIGGIFFYIIMILSRGGLGGGDVKFAFVLGLWLGFDGILAAILTSLLFASAAGIILSIKRKNLKTSIPFGPFISFGALSVFFFKFQLLEVYENCLKFIYN